MQVTSVFLLYLRRNLTYSQLSDEKSINEVCPIYHHQSIEFTLNYKTMKKFFDLLTIMLIIAIASLILHPFLWVVIVYDGGVYIDSESACLMFTFLFIYIIVGGLTLYLCRKMSWRKKAFAMFLSINTILVISVLLYTYHAINDGMTGLMFLTMCITNVILSAIPISLGCYLVYKKNTFIG